MNPIVNRSTLLREVERASSARWKPTATSTTRVQFDGTEAGLQFLSAWKQAGIIADAGHGIPTPATPPTP